jgi:nucleoside-diphosphate-sugar epimerase
MMAGKTILVTGATGFLGGRVVERLVLEEQATVRVLLRSPERASRIASLPVEFRKGDVTDQAAFNDAARGCEAVIHCASRIEGGVAPEQTSTCLGTQIAAKACAEVGARLIHISSCAVYGIPAVESADETQPYQPRHKKDTYARAKIAAERFLKPFAGEHHLKAAILQPTIIYGPHSEEWTTTPLSLLRSADIAMPDPDASVCNAVYVDDVVTAAFLAVAKCDESCQSYVINGDDLPTWTGFLSRHAALGTNGSIVPLKQDALDRLRAEARTSRSFVKTGMKLLRERPDVRSAILSTGLASGALNIMQKIVPTRALESLRKKLKGSPDAGLPVVGFPSPAKLPLQLPPPHFLEMATQTFRFTSEKARRDLGYAPRFSLDAAFDRIATWARWSRLVS